MLNAKKKGNKGEWAFVHWLRQHGFYSHRNAMSGGGVWKGDIANNMDFCFEVKTVKKLNLMEAWRQVNTDSGKSHATPVLVIHFDHMPKDSWLVVMESGDWIEHLKKP